MALKVKAVERLLKFDKNDPGSYRYVLKPELYTSLDQKEVKRVTSTSGEVEDPENQNSDSNSGTDIPPVINP